MSSSIPGQNTLSLTNWYTLSGSSYCVAPYILACAVLDGSVNFKFSYFSCKEHCQWSLAFPNDIITSWNFLVVHFALFFSASTFVSLTWLLKLSLDPHVWFVLSHLRRCSSHACHWIYLYCQFLVANHTTSWSSYFLTGDNMALILSVDKIWCCSVTSIGDLLRQSATLFWMSCLSWMAVG